MEQSKDALAQQLKKTFDQIPNDIPVYLFTEKGRDDVFAQANREIIRVFRQITDKIVFKEFDLTHEQAKKWGVDAAPTLLINPEHYGLKWLGAPMGEEGRTFLEMIILAGLHKSHLSEQSLNVIKRINTPRKIKVFVSPTCPYCPQQAVNAVKAAIELPKLISLEIIDIQANPELADQYAAQSVPQVYANETLIAQGAQTEELFMASLEKMVQQTIFIPDSDAEKVEADLVIIGGGPAGLTAAIYAARSGLQTVVVEKGTLGGQVATTPIVENYPGFTQVGGKTLVDIMVSHALEYVKIFPGEEVMDIELGDPITVKSTRRRFRTKVVLFATGANHRHLDVPGELSLSGRGVSYCSTCDGPLFKGKRVLMVGGGDSAVTEALHLKNIGVDVTLVHRKDTLRCQDHLKKNLSGSQIPIVFNSEIKEILGKERVEGVKLYNNETEKNSTMDVDGVFVAIGYSPAVELAKKIGLELTQDGFIKRDSRHRTNIAGIYSAGDVEGGYKQIVTAAGQGSEAALAIFEDLVNPYWKSKKRA